MWRRALPISALSERTRSSKRTATSTRCSTSRSGNAPGYPERKDILTSPALRVATKYVNTAKRLFSERGEDVEIIPLHGSIELAPVTDLSDVIFDVVQTGSTLKANGLVVLEEVFTGITARLVANKVSLKTKSAEILPLIAKVKEEVA